jgi:egghead protein (zeste-white 4 protein)
MTTARRRVLSQPRTKPAARVPIDSAPRIVVLRRKAQGRRLALPPRARRRDSWRLWGYRLWLAAATAALTGALLWLQHLLGAVPAHPTGWQVATQRAELIWLAPAPLAVALWLGWMLFAEAAQPDPPLTDVPLFTHRRRGGTFAARLVFRFATRGDNLEVLRESVAAVHAAFAAYRDATGPYRVEVVSERPLDLADETGLVALYTVPDCYKTPAGSRYKARALTYLQSRTHPSLEDWHVYLDEESTIDAAFVAGVYRFIRRGVAGGVCRPLIGQGPIVYQGGSWFFRGADALRTADDLGRFRLQYALGLPIFGVHGSYIVLRGTDDARLSFDVGPHNSLTEDAAWALRAWSRGYRFAWVEGYLREQPPQRARDFVRQRARWLSGIRLVVRDRAVPLRYRALLAVFTALWQLAFIPFVVAVAALVQHIAPYGWMRLPADFAWATFVLAYLQGAHLQATRLGHVAHLAHVGHVPQAAEPGRRPQGQIAALRHLAAALGTRLRAWAMALCYIWFALLEAVGVLASLLPRNDFYVIHKPALHHEAGAQGDDERDLAAVPAGAAGTAGTAGDEKMALALPRGVLRTEPVA